MGAGIAQVLATAGHRVLLCDAGAGAAEGALASIFARIDKLAAKGRLTTEQVRVILDRLRPVSSLDSFVECGLVIEAIVEDLEAKRTLFKQIEAVVPDETILATNTSSISVTAIGAMLRRPQRFAGLHFFNPAPLMPLVEIIRGAATDLATTGVLHATALRWGKTPVDARSTPGFIVNRVARPFYAESLRLLDEGAADCATIDAVLREAGGFRMGSFELMDLIGNDVNYAVTKSVFDAFYGDSRFTPSLRQLELVEAGFLGRKSGRGFYEYGEDVAVVAPRTADASVTPLHLRICGGGQLAVHLAARLAGAGVRFERLEKHSDGRIADGDEFVLYRTDGRTATARSAECGVPQTVLVDLAFDESKASRLALSVADQAPAGAGGAAAGLLQAAGYAVSVIDDVPGMIVMRTVAMLANEAAEAVYHGVCSAAGCDLAMRKGVNYPRGPLEWADRLGLAEVVRVLDNIAQAYGEDRYRVSALLRRKAIAGDRFVGVKEEDHG